MKNPNKHSSPLRGYFIWALAAFFYAYEFVLRVSPSVIVENLILEFSAFELSKATLGHVSAFYFYAYALTQVPAGLLAERYSKKILLTLACLLTTGGTFLFASTYDINVAYFSRFIIGVGSAFAFVSCLSLAKDFIPSHQFPIIVGLTNAAGMIGAIVGNQPLASVVTHWGWREAFYALGYLGLFLSLLLWVFIPKSIESKGRAIKALEANPFLSLKQTLKSKQTWLLAFYGCLLVAPIATFGELWGVAFFQVRFSLTKEVASSLISWIFMGIMVGGPLIGLVASRVKNLKKVMAISSALALLTLLCVLYAPGLSLFNARVLLFFYGLFTSNMLLCFSLISLHHKKEGHSTAIGFTNMMIMALGATFQPWVGVLLDMTKGTQSGAHSVLPSIFEFRAALSMLPLCVFIALLLLYWVRLHPTVQRETLQIS